MSEKRLSRSEQRAKPGAERKAQGGAGGPEWVSAQSDGLEPRCEQARRDSWYEQAAKRLKDERKNIKGSKENAMKSEVLAALLEFAQQSEEFAQAVVQGGSFQECMAAVAKGVGGSISDLEAYRRAAAFYFDGAKVEFQMQIQLEPAQAEAPADHILIELSDFF